jgi:hypothetical protein
MEGENIKMAIAGIEYLSFILCCKNCGNEIGQYDADSSSAVRKCLNPECFGLPYEPQWFDSNSPEFQAVVQLRDALRVARNVINETRTKEEFAFKMLLTLQHKGPCKPHVK